MQHNELLCGLLNHFQDLLHSEDFLEEFRVADRFVRKSKLSMENELLPVKRTVKNQKNWTTSN